MGGPIREIENQRAEKEVAIAAKLVAHSRQVARVGASRATALGVISQSIAE